MKKEIIVIALIAILFVLVAGSILASFTFYGEYKDKMGYMEQQNMAVRTRIDDIENKIESFRTRVNDIADQIGTYSNTLKAIQNTVNLTDEERKALVAKLEEMKKDLQEWQKNYSTTFIDIKQAMLNLKDDLDKMRNKPREVELGKITVKQEEQKPAVTAVPTPAPEAKKTTGSNFKSGNVRKVGSN